MTRILFLGCNHDQLPYLEACRALGHTVIATDRNPEAAGKVAADRFYPVSYLDTAGLLAVAAGEDLGPTDRIFTAAAHLAWESAARVAELRGIPHPSPEAVRCCLDKTRCYALLSELGLAIPPTRRHTPEKPVRLDPTRVYYVKSDYGKSPRYCFRADDGRLPPLPQDFDEFYRACFLVQEEIRGMHLRLDLYAGETAVFRTFGPRAALPVRSLDAAHEGLTEKLRGFVRVLGLTGCLVKFDLIITEQTAYVLDVGLDPPLRLELLCRHRNIDFAYAYTSCALKGEFSGMPPWDEIYAPVLIRTDRTPSVTPLVFTGNAAP